MCPAVDLAFISTSDEQQREPPQQLGLFVNGVINHADDLVCQHLKRFSLPCVDAGITDIEEHIGEAVDEAGIGKFPPDSGVEGETGLGAEQDLLGQTEEAERSIHVVHLGFNDGVEQLD